MLSAADIRGIQRRRRSAYSDKQHYQEYILQRIEGYKNSIGRDELMRLGDEAAAELQSASEGQFLLTEVLMLESVDRLIMKRLALRPYNKWKRQFVKLREAQRTPTHWGLEAGGPVSRLLLRIESNDATLVIGGGAEPCAYLLAAYDAAVTFIASDMGAVERVESRMAAEALGSLFDGFVAELSPALPDFLCFVTGLDLVIIDPSAIAELKPSMRPAAVYDLQRRTRPGGVHLLLPTCKSLAPEALLGLYNEWTVEEEPKPRRRSGTSRVREGLLLTCPSCPADTT
jgi:hypothetical protein